MPKQFLDILGAGKSLLRQTFERFRPYVEDENFIVVTNRRYRELAYEQLPELKPHQILCEPIGRNTAPCICYAAYPLLMSEPDAKMIVTPADLFITDEERFLEVVDECVEFTTDHDALVTIGVKPTRPDSGYGYIQVSDPKEISRAKCFIEKPNAEMAQTLLECGEFFWNSGIFIWKVRDIVSAIERHLPEHAALFGALVDFDNSEDAGKTISRIFSECRAISIDYGVMERADNVFVRTGEFGWSDVGTWGAVYQHSPKDVDGNTLFRNLMLYDTQNTAISLPNGKLGVIAGLKDYMVVDTEDVLMICPKEEEKSIKKYMEDVKYREGDKFI